MSATLVRPRPPIALGLLALAAATTVMSGIELRWVRAPGITIAALVLVGFTAPLQAVVAGIATARRDSAFATGMGLLSATWLTLGLVLLTTPPGRRTNALGLFMVVAGTALWVPGVMAAIARRLPAVVLLVAGVRLVLIGGYELTAVRAVEVVAGIVGLALGALAFAVALGIELGERRREVSRRNPPPRRPAGASTGPTPSARLTMRVRQQLRRRASR